MVGNGEKRGLPVDATGNHAIDPTRNVLDLVDSAIQRQDDLRAATDRRQDDLRAATKQRHDEMRAASERRIDELRGAEKTRIDEIAFLRASHARELNEAETKRIDAIRAVDVAAVAIANERATASATVLANQVAQSAETLRSLVATTAAASAQQSSASFGQLSDRITLLERTSYEGSGKSAVADPMMAKMIQTLDQMQLNMAKGAGREALSTPLLMTIAAAATGLAVFLIQTAIGG